MRRAWLGLLLLFGACGAPYDPAACLRSPNITMSYDPRPEPKGIVSGWDGERTVCYEGYNAGWNEQLAKCRAAGIKDCKLVAQDKMALVPVAPAQSNDAVYDVLGAAAFGAATGYNQTQDDRLIAQRTANAVTAAQAAAPPRKVTCTPVWGSNRMTCK
jgi:hypothetical protein